MIPYSLEVAKLLAKKVPMTSKNGGKKGFFQFGFMKKEKKESKATDEIKKKESIFEEILEKPSAPMPKTSRNGERKSFKFFEEPKEQ